MQQVYLVHLKPRQALVQAAHEVVVIALADLARQPDVLFAATCLENFADALLALSVTVALGGVDVGDAQIERLVQRPHPCFFVVLNESAASAKSQDGCLGSGLAQYPGRHGRCPVSGDRCQRSCRGAFQKLASGDAHSVPPGSLAYHGSPSRWSTTLRRWGT